MGVGADPRARAATNLVTVVSGGVSTADPDRGEGDGGIDVAYVSCPPAPG
jgi:hypothetical protein